MAVLIDGKAVAQKIKDSVKEQIATMEHKPCLAVIVVGNNPASAVYVRNKKKDCEEVGMECHVHNLPEDVSEDTVCAMICTLNLDPNISGIICQLPLPKGLNERKILSRINKNKDVDGFYSWKFDPCTPLGIITMLEYYGIVVEGKHCVVVGRSEIVGKPMARMLLDKNGTVTICHSKTKDMASITKQADILVAAVGKRNLITSDMVKDGAVVIDVGINRDENGKLCGDVDFESVAEKASYITPVPGGVGPMTRVMLLVNTVRAAGLDK